MQTICSRLGMMNETRPPCASHCLQSLWRKKANEMADGALASLYRFTPEPSETHDGDSGVQRACHSSFVDLPNQFRDADINSSVEPERLKLKSMSQTSCFLRSCSVFLTLLFEYPHSSNRKLWHRELRRIFTLFYELSFQNYENFLWKRTREHQRDLILINGQLGS